MDEKHMNVPLNFNVLYLKTNLCYWGIFLLHFLSDFDDSGVIKKGIKRPNKIYDRIFFSRQRNQKF